MKKYILIFILSLSLSSCDKFLEPDQVDLVYNEIFWKTEKDAHAGVLGIYSLYRGLMLDANWFDRGDFTTGYFRRGHNDGSDPSLYNPGEFDINPISRNQWSWGEINDMANWGKFYKVVAQANLVIKQVEGMPDNVFTGANKKHLLGEAYFLRALVYFNILRTWGNAPYINESIESSNQVINNDLTPVIIPRTKDTDIGENIISDLKIAEEYLVYSNRLDTYWGIRANKGSVHALSGHVNMWMHFLSKHRGLSNAQQYLTNAITSLELLVKNGGYELVPYHTPDALSNLFKGQSSEAVFELNVSSEMNESYRIDRNRSKESITCRVKPFDGSQSKDRTSMINWIPFSQKQKIYPDYNFTTKSGDIRADLFFGAWDSNYEAPYSDIAQTETDRDKVTWLKKYSMLSVDGAHSWDEYVAYFADANIPVFRYTDVYLLLAEAYVKNNESGKALPIVNEIRTRAGLNTYSGSDLAKEIMQQRISELIGEGYLYYDMVRNNYFPNEQIMDPARYNRDGFYWPVSKEILLANKQISQTPYWSGKTKW